MNKKIIILVVVIILVVAGAFLLKNYVKPYSSGTETDIGPSAGQPAGNIVTIADFSFSPKTLTVPAGTEVVWKNGDAATHAIAADGGSFASQNMGKGGEFRFTFNAAGTFGYHCSIHPSMTGQIIVQ